MSTHPLLDLSEDEIRQAANIVRQLHREQALVFKAITLEEPRKELVLQYFKAQEEGSSLPSIPRLAFAAYYLRGTVRFQRGSTAINTDAGTGQFHHHLRQPYQRNYRVHRENEPQVSRKR